MKKEELKKMLRPLIKECIREVIFEDGSLSTIISEVMKTNPQQPVIQERESNPGQVKFESPEKANQRLQERTEAQKQKRKALLDSIGRDAYNGVDLFEGVEPLSNRDSGRSSQSPHGARALDGVAPGDPGVDISKFASSGIWKKLAEGK